jgi:hypothetical protein
MLVRILNNFDWILRLLKCVGRGDDHAILESTHSNSIGQKVCFIERKK